MRPHLNTDHPEIEKLNRQLFVLPDLTLSNVTKEEESADYAAHRFQINENKVIFRVAKITPNKTGQFVSIWKRNEKGQTAPFDDADDFDYVFIVTNTLMQSGCFLFPKKVLQEKNILSNQCRGGKRGIRVYPPWDEAESKQAKQTQLWQMNYFLEISDNINPHHIINLLNGR